MADAASLPQSIRLLGPFQLRLEGSICSLPHGVERVIALTAIVGPLARHRAAALLWPDADETRSSANLRSALSRLTTTATAVLHASGEVLALADDVSVDLVDAMNWINQTIYDAARTAVTEPPPAMSSELLPGWDDEWLESPRERLRLLHSQALECAAERLVAGGRTAEALPYALSAVQAQPWSESANRLIIEIHARRGDPSNALRRYRQFRRELQSELGVQPGPEIMAAIRQLYPFGTNLNDGP